MPLYLVLVVLIILNVLFIGATALLGITLHDADSVMQHYVAGMLTSIFTCFIHPCRSYRTRFAAASRGTGRPDLCVPGESR